MLGPGGMAPPLDAPLALGSVGWQDDGGEYYELGDASNDGNTLVRVTLFRGRDPSSPLDHTQAQGQKLLCKVGGGFFRIPPRGTTVLVAVPEPFGMIPGGSTILQAMDVASGDLGNSQPGEYVIGTPPNCARIFIKNNGAIALYTQVGNSKSGGSVAIQVNPDGSASMAGPHGAIATTSSGTKLASGSDSAIQLDANGVSLIGKALGVNAGSVSLGATPTDGIVLQTLLAPQLADILAVLNAIATCTTSAGAVPTSGISGAQAAAVVAAITSLTIALGVPNYSTSCKASH